MRDPAFLVRFPRQAASRYWPCLFEGDQVGPFIYAVKCKPEDYSKLVVSSPATAHPRSRIAHWPYSRTTAISTRVHLTITPSESTEHTMKLTRWPSSRRGSFFAVCKRLILPKDRHECTPRLVGEMKMQRNARPDMTSYHSSRVAHRVWPRTEVSDIHPPIRTLTRLSSTYVNGWSWSDTFIVYRLHCLSTDILFQTTNSDTRSGPVTCKVWQDNPLRISRFYLRGIQTYCSVSCIQRFGYSVPAGVEANTTDRHESDVPL